MTTKDMILLLLFCLVFFGLLGGLVAFAFGGPDANIWKWVAGGEIAGMFAWLNCVLFSEDK